ncbi:putative uncharacterized protein DDB_G0282133 isoform X2 [Oppia nitens]|uniref:putative uncharacterized protein DDB_G0282133 isoform X2 n=1 Tax=Oppia nitens TaxID=1686743 RepID=UPI0023DB48EC|nr:putative uncharacterized protein DDB_G0282133 isoform X2 [Oppia nitens]
MTEMIDNSSSSTTEIDVFDNLSEDQLKDVLDQLTDHSRPNSEKCPLVRRLKEENASREEPDLVIACRPQRLSTTTRPTRKYRRSGSKEAEFAREKSNGSVINSVSSSKSLQDLMSANTSEYDMRAIGANRGGKRLNKDSRANSLTMPPVSTQHLFNNNSIKNDVFNSDVRNKTLKGRVVGQHPKESGCNESTNSSRVYNECPTTHTVVNHNMDSCDKNYTPNCNSCASDDQHIHPKNEYIEMHDLGRRVNLVQVVDGKLVDCEQQIKTNESTTLRSANNVDTCPDFGLKAINSRDAIKSGSERVVNNCDYNSKESTNDINEDNKMMYYHQPETGKPYDPTPTYLTNTYHDSDVSSASPFNPIYQSYQSATKSEPTNSRIAKSKNKKRMTAEAIKAEDIAGHIGNKDLEFLVEYVNSAGGDSSIDINSKNGSILANNSVKENVKKKNQMTNNSVSKRKNGSNVNSNQSASHKSNSVSANIPLSSSSSSSSDEGNSVSKHSDFAQRTNSQTHETTSPLNSSSESNDKKLSREDSDFLEEETLSLSTHNSFSLIESNISADLLCTASDSEMADREKGFVTPKSKHFKRRMHRQENQRFNKSQSMQSSTSTTPSSSTVSGAGVSYERFSGMRGYESEREYTDDFRRYQSKSVCSRRKSVPHSEHNSAYNSDGEMSCHSMPIRNDSLKTEKIYSESRTTPSSISSTPKASYADIAKTDKKSSIDTIISHINKVQYPAFSQLDSSLSLMVDDLTPSTSQNNSQLIESNESLQQNVVVTDKQDLINDSYSATITSMTNTPEPQTDSLNNECLLSETVKNNSIDMAINSSKSDSVVPPVIMLDYSESVPTKDLDNISFGFFDDVILFPNNINNDKSQTNILNETLEERPDCEAKSPFNTSLESESQMNSPIVKADPMAYIDVDKRSFNYDHILGFIKKAWDNAKRDNHYQCYESRPKVK